MHPSTVFTNTHTISRPDMATYEARLKTFENWPRSNPTPSELTQAGFYHLKDGDKTKCFYCSIILWQWQETDNPWVEHAIWSGRCPYFFNFFNFVENERVVRRKNKLYRRYTSHAYSCRYVHLYNG